MSDRYIPNARDAVIARFGRTDRGLLRCHCLRCNDTSPLTDSDPVYGDLYISEGPEDRLADESVCDACGITLLAISVQCQADHDAQQAEWARGPVLTLSEYGIPSAARCRVY